MSPRFGVRIIVLTIATLVASSVTAFADYEAARRLLDLSPDPVERSPRLLGMGRLTMVGRDRHNHVSLWDFAGNPVGVFSDDSVSTFEARPSTASADTKHDEFTTGIPRDRQELGAREVRLGYELWRRTDHTVYGLAGALSSLRLDTPYGVDIERRSKFGVPSVMGLLGGDLPYVTPGRWGYAVRFQYQSETSDDEYRTFVRTESGDYLDEDGITIDPPNEFDPTHADVNTRGIGGGLSYRFGSALTLALGGDVVQQEITLENTGSRHTSSLTEERPYNLGQGTVVGVIGGLEYGVDARLWEGASQIGWLFTISGGQGGTPLAGRGNHSKRDEHGNQVRGRARYEFGDLELGGAFATGYRKVTTNPVAPDDPGSFNHFLNTVFDRATADSLSLPDSIVFRREEEREWSAGAGFSWRVLGGSVLWGNEFSVSHGSFNTTRVGAAVVRSGFSLASGLEYRCTSTLTGRAGYRYRNGDRNEDLALDEFQSHGLTLGASYAPTGSVWGMDAGYLLDWIQSDFDDPTTTHGSRQQLALQLRWTF